jgi:hypothetical protein
MANTIEPQTFNVCGSIVLTIVMFVVLLYWPLYCLWFYCIGHCIVCGSIVLAIVLFVVYNRTTNITIVNTIEPQTLQWPIQ